MDDSIHTRDRYKFATELDKRRILETLENLVRGKINAYKIDGLEKPYGPVNVNIEANSTDYAKPKGPFMILGGIASLGMFNSFTKKTRRYPIWLSLEQAEDNISEYTIPQGFHFEYIPENVSIKNEFLDLNVSYERKGNIVRRSEHVHYKRAVIPPEEYPAFKEFLLKCEGVLGEAIVLRKGN